MWRPKDWVNPHSYECQATEGTPCSDCWEPSLLHSGFEEGADKMLSLLRKSGVFILGTPQKPIQLQHSEIPELKIEIAAHGRLLFMPDHGDPQPK